MPGARNIHVIRMWIQPGDQPDERQDGIIITAVKELIGTYPEEPSRGFAESEQGQQEELVIKSSCSVSELGLIRLKLLSIRATTSIRPKALRMYEIVSLQLGVLR